MQRAVTNLLDTLAPERATTRTERTPVPIERYRTPSGCVLQGATAALSVSWFPGAASDMALGELHMVLWRGVVTRRGGTVPKESASVIRELTFRPVENSPETPGWRDETDGKVYDLQGLAERGLALLNEQVLADDPTGTAQSTSPRRRD